MDESIKLKLLAGLPFEVKDICIIKPLTLKQIITIGWEQYNLYLSNLIAEVSDYNITDLDLSQYTYWDILMSSMCYSGKENQEMIIKAISIFLGKGIFFDKKTCLFYTDEGKQIDKNIFDEIRQILRWQNCVKENRQIEEKYADDRARQLAEKFKKYREKFKSKKDENAITLKNMISGISARHPSINLLNIWDLTLYQLYDQLSRLNLVDNYNFSFFLLPYSEDAGKNIKHWTTNIKEDDI